MPKLSKPYAELTPTERKAKSQQTSKSRRRAKEKAQKFRHQMLLENSDAIDPNLSGYEGAALLGVSIDSFRKAVKNGQIPPGTRIGARRLVWKRSVIAALT